MNSDTRKILPIKEVKNEVQFDYLCLTVPPPLAALGATALVGDLLPAPTDVELGEAGFICKTKFEALVITNWNKAVTSV